MRYSTAKEVENHPTLVQVPSRGALLNFVIKLTSLKFEIFRYFLVKNTVILALAVLSQYTGVTER